jgi:DNA primase
MKACIKLFMTTNHAINGEGASFKDRQSFMAFSDYYNEQHKPVDDFGINFFSEWDNDQWNLFYNLMANCLILYFRSLREGWSGKNAGIVEPPMESIEKRHLRQMIGEDFLQWADAAFTSSSSGFPTGESKLNSILERKKLFDEFMEQFPHARKYITSTSFGKRMKHYCRFKGLHFNPNKSNEEGIDFFTFRKKYPGGLFDGEADKTGGKEYWTIANNVWSQ